VHGAAADAETAHQLCVCLPACPTNLVDASLWDQHQIDSPAATTAPQTCCRAVGAASDAAAGGTAAVGGPVTGVAAAAVLVELAVAVPTTACPSVPALRAILQEGAPRAHPAGQSRMPAVADTAAHAVGDWRQQHAFVLAVPQPQVPVGPAGNTHNQRL